MQAATEMMQHTQHVHDPFWFGIVIGGLGVLVIVERLIRGKVLTKIRGTIAIVLLLMGAAIAYGFLERLIDPVITFAEKFAG